MVADQRAFEINEENSLTKKQEKQLRAYLCKDCGLFHLTSLPEKVFNKRITAINNKTKKNEERFINKEVTFWEKYFKIK